MGIIKDTGRGPIALDTCVFIYYIEQNKQYIEVVDEIFHAIAEGHIKAITSGITLLELLVVPFRTNDVKLAEQYRSFLLESPGLRLVELTEALLCRAAALRAQLGIKTPDALQIGAAQQMECTCFITNDRRFPKIPGLRVLQLDEF